MFFTWGVCKLYFCENLPSRKLFYDGTSYDCWKPHGCCPVYWHDKETETIWTPWRWLMCFCLSFIWDRVIQSHLSSMLSTPLQNQIIHLVYNLYIALSKVHFFFSNPVWNKHYYNVMERGDWNTTNVSMT